MTESVALPLWLVVAVGLFALWALYEHVVVPALRWMLTHPANRVIEDVSTRLRIASDKLRSRNLSVVPSAARRLRRLVSGSSARKSVLSSSTRS